jgi:hypothetical protein
LSKTTRNFKILVLFLLTSALFVAGVSSGVKASGTDSVVVFSSIGGTTVPTSGSYNYTDGSVQTFTATAGTGFLFGGWQIATAAGSYTDTDNPLSLTLNQSEYALQANFVPIQFLGPAGATLNTATDAIVVILAGVGGTVSPAPGTYALATVTNLELKATADSGFTFSHWVIGGTPMNHGVYAYTDMPTDNPYNVNHGYGNTYSYQPVFTAVSPATSPTATPKVDEFSSVAAILVAAILVIVAFGTYAITKKTRK